MIFFVIVGEEFVFRHSHAGDSVSAVCLVVGHPDGSRVAIPFVEIGNFGYIRVHAFFGFVIPFEIGDRQIDGIGFGLCEIVALICENELFARSERVFRTVTRNDIDGGCGKRGRHRLRIVVVLVFLSRPESAFEQGHSVGIDGFAAVVVDDEVFVIETGSPFIIGCPRYINLFENKGVARGVDR